MGRDREPVGEEHGVEQSAFGQRRSRAPGVACRSDRRLVLVQPPAGLVIAVGVEER